MRPEKNDHAIEFDRGDISRRRKRARKADRLGRKLDEVRAQRTAERRALGKAREALAAMIRAARPYEVALNDPDHATGEWAETNKQLVDARRRAQAAIELADERLQEPHGESHPSP